MRKLLNILRRALGLANLIAIVLAFSGMAGAPSHAVLATKFQFLPALLKLDWTVLLVIVLVTVLFGRFYCEVICPLGVWQDLIRINEPRRVCCKLPVSKLQWCVRIPLVLLALAFPWVLDPYAIFGRYVMGAEIVTFIIVTLLAFVAHGRIWCNWICPVGTIFSISQLPRRHNAKFTQFNSHCKDCRKCFPVAHS